MKKVAPEIKLSALTENSQVDFLATAGESNADIISPEFRLIHRDNVAAVHSVGLQIIPWTPNTLSDWEVLISAEVDAIITDDPAALIEYLGVG